MQRAFPKRPLDVELVVQFTCSELARRRSPTEHPAPPKLPVTPADAILVGRWDRPPSYPTIAPMWRSGFASPGRGPLQPPHPDADIVAAKIDELPAAMAGLLAPEALAADLGTEGLDVAGAWASSVGAIIGAILTHGRRANRPLIATETPSVRARLAPNGKVAIWREAVELTTGAFGDTVERRYLEPTERIKGGYPTGSFCLIDFEPDHQLRLNERADFLAWRTGLDVLYGLISGKLDSITVLPAGCATTPWLGEVDDVPIADLFGPGAERLYSLKERISTDLARVTRQRRAPLARVGGYSRRPARPRRIARTGQ